MTYEKFEHLAIKTLLGDGDVVHELLFEQFLASEVAQRKETEQGFTVMYETPVALRVKHVILELPRVIVSDYKETLMHLELTVEEGGISRLCGVYVRPLKYMNIVRHLPDLTFKTTFDELPVFSPTSNMFTEEKTRSRLFYDIPRQMDVTDNTVLKVSMPKEPVVARRTQSLRPVNEETVVPKKKMTKPVVFRVLNAFFGLTVVFSVLLLFLFLMQQLAGGNRDIFGFSAHQMVTGSMAPTLEVDSFILARRVPAASLYVGDIITYWHGENARTVTHRIYEIFLEETGEVSGFMLRGDANVLMSYELVSPTDVIGRVVFSSLVMGRLLMFFERNYLLLIVIVILGVLYLHARKQIQVQQYGNKK